MEDCSSVDDSIWRRDTCAPCVGLGRGIRCERSPVSGIGSGVADGCTPYESLLQPSIEFVEVVRCVCTESLDGSLCACSTTVPCLQLGITRSHKERELLRVMCRVEHGDRVWLREPCEEEEVRILSEGMLDVVVASLKVSSRDDRDRIAKLFHESGAPGRKAGLIHISQATANAPSRDSRFGVVDSSACELLSAWWARWDSNPHASD